ncbi:MAG: hypothetical protein KBA50_07520 [Sedimentibacter sp.]|jgi:hypothetical protein|nr:hypothetical protein [Sedimentibacter sp.]
MKHKAYKAAVWTGAFLFLFPLIVYANSSWHWVTASPMKVLPFAVVFTILIETASVTKLGGVSDSKKAFYIICLANLMSFIAPYLERAYRFIPTSGYSIFAAFNKGPYYIVLAGYLILTVAVELPIVYFLLRKYSLNRKNLLISIILSNTVTTLLVAVCERIICVGRW